MSAQPFPTHNDLIVQLYHPAITITAACESGGSRKVCVMRKQAISDSNLTGAEISDDGADS